MILNWLIDAVYAILHPLVALLPSGSSVEIPGAASVAAFIGQVDYLIPIVGVLKVALAMLSAVVVFFGVRLALVVWQQLKW
jgi:hypothetical protein